MIQAGDNLCALFSRYVRKTNNEQVVEKDIDGRGTTNDLFGTTEKHQDYGNARLVEMYVNTAEESVCDCTKVNGLKCALCAERDSLKCNFCPMVFVDKCDVERHLLNSHSERYSENTPESAKETTVALPRLKMTIRKSSAGARVRSGRTENSVKSKKKDGEADLSSPCYQCTVCSKVCLSLRGLTRHSTVHKNDASVGAVDEIKQEICNVSCTFCQQTFSCEDDKWKHISEYHRISVAESAAGTSKSDLDFQMDEVVNGAEEHIGQEDEKENIAGTFKTEVQDKNTKSTQSIKGSKRKVKRKTTTDSGETTKAFTCDECGKTFDKKTLFTRHTRTHNKGSGEFTCDVCGKLFVSELVLKRHKGNVHRTKRVKLPEEEDPFTKWYVFADGQKHLKCDQCKYNSLWYHKGRFLEHYRIHTGEKPFTCDLCGKQFRTKTLLQKHVMFVHEGIKEHPCDICGRCFSDKRYMEDHRRIHTGERPYVCDLCGKTFKQSASLFIHKELHKGLRKHGCDMCGKRFTTRSSLTIHIKRHVGERNFVCATCGKAFVDGKHLKDHMSVHSEERPFSCELCGGRFKLMKHLKQHGRTHKRFSS